MGVVAAARPLSSAPGCRNGPESNGLPVGVSRPRGSLHLRVLGGRAPAHPTKSAIARGPRGALKPASGGLALRRYAALAALLLAPPHPWLRPPMPRNMRWISESGHSGMFLPASFIWRLNGGDAGSGVGAHRP